MAKEEEVRKEGDFEVAEPRANSKVKLSLRRRSSLKLSVHFSYFQHNFNISLISRGG